MSDLKTFAILDGSVESPRSHYSLVVRGDTTNIEACGSGLSASQEFETARFRKEVIKWLWHEGYVVFKARRGPGKGPWHAPDGLKDCKVIVSGKNAVDIGAFVCQDGESVTVATTSKGLAYGVEFPLLKFRDAVIKWLSEGGERLGVSSEGWNKLPWDEPPPSKTKQNANFKAFLEVLGDILNAGPNQSASQALGEVAVLVRKERRAREECRVLRARVHELESELHNEAQAVDEMCSLSAQAKYRRMTK